MSIQLKNQVAGQGPLVPAMCTRTEVLAIERDQVRAGPVRAGIARVGAGQIREDLPRLDSSPSHGVIMVGEQCLNQCGIRVFRE